MRLRILAGLLCGLFVVSVQADGIVGPEQVEPGNMAVFRADGEPATEYQWAILPKSAGGQFFNFTERDASGAVVSSTAIFASSKPGTYSVVLARVTGGKLSLDTHALINGGDEPPPDPQPPGPEPPEPEPKPTGWAKWTKGEVERVIPPEGRAEAAQKIAAAFESVCSAGQAGIYKDASQFRSTLKVTARLALGDRAELWEERFDNPVLTPAIKKLADEGKLKDTVKDHCRLYEEIAKGFRLVTGTAATAATDCKDGSCPDPNSQLQQLKGQWRVR